MLRFASLGLLTLGIKYQLHEADSPSIYVAFLLAARRCFAFCFGLGFGLLLGFALPSRFSATAARISSFSAASLIFSPS